MYSCPMPPLPSCVPLIKRLCLFPPPQTANNSQRLYFRCHVARSNKQLTAPLVPVSFLVPCKYKGRHLGLLLNREGAFLIHTGRIPVKLVLVRRQYRRQTVFCVGRGSLQLTPAPIDPFGSYLGNTHYKRGHVMNGGGICAVTQTGPFLPTSRVCVGGGGGVPTSQDHP